MKDQRKTKNDLIRELTELRSFIEELKYGGWEQRSGDLVRQDIEELFRKIFAESPIAIQLCDSDGQFIDMNQACLDMFGMSRISDYAYEWRGIFDGPFMPEETKVNLLAGHPVRFEVTFDYDDARQKGVYKGTKTGTSFYDVLVSPLGLEEEYVSGYLFQMQDVTKHKQAEAALRDSEELFRSIFEQSPIGIQISDADGTFIRVNKACLEMFDVPDISNSVWTNIFQGTYMPDEAKARAREGEVVRFEVPVNFDKLKGKLLYRGSRSGLAFFDVLVSPLGLERGNPTGYLSQVQEITERKRAEKSLRELSRRLVDIQESERQHIARELHDEIGQALTGLKLLVDMAIRRAGKGTSLGLDEVEQTINELMDRVSALSLNLRPSMLDDLGLLPTLLWYLERYKIQTGIYVSFKHEGLPKRLSTEVETAVYRIIQEALTNVVRHSGAGQVKAELAVFDNTLKIKVEDNGCGFDTVAVADAGTSSGLYGMRERAISVGGHLTVKSWPKSGTSVFAEIPVGDQVKDEP